jgi:hypothetical protein
MIIRTTISIAEYGNLFLLISVVLEAYEMKSKTSDKKLSEIALM